MRTTRALTALSGTGTIHRSSILTRRRAFSRRWHQEEEEGTAHSRLPRSNGPARDLALDRAIIRPVRARLAILIHTIRVRLVGKIRAGWTCLPRLRLLPVVRQVPQGGARAGGTWVWTMTEPHPKRERRYRRARVGRGENMWFIRSIFGR